MAIRMIFLGIFCCALCSCKESSLNKYESRELAAAAGAIDRGWVPEFLPERAFDIVESHSVDANHFRVEFSIHIEDYAEMLKDGALVTLPASTNDSVRRKISLPSWSTLGRGKLQPIAKCNDLYGGGLGLVNIETGRVHYMEPASLPDVCSESRGR